MTFSQIILCNLPRIDWYKLWMYCGVMAVQILRGTHGTCTYLYSPSYQHISIFFFSCVAINLLMLMSGLCAGQFIVVIAVNKILG